MSDSAADWQDFWATGGTGDAAWASQAHRDFLAQHWRGVFAGDANPALTIVDIGSGDGAALRYATRSVRIAIDIAPAAARAAAKASPGLIGVAADAAQLPLADRSVDVVVSQFGIEYAGVAAFAEATRVLKPWGAFSAVCHLRGGAIEAVCAHNARLLTALIDSGLAARASAALAASYRLQAEGRPPRDAAREGEFGAAFATVAQMLAQASNSPAKRAIEHFMAELSILSTRRMAYEPSEALTWITRMSNTLEAYLGRMNAMVRVALDQAQAEAICAMFRDNGFGAASAKPVHMTSEVTASAWLIEAKA